MGPTILAAAPVESAVFVICAVIVLSGAFGVVLSKNPVHSALSLVGTLFGVAVLFIAQNVQFLAAVQVIVYTGAIVVLFLFVIMLLGVDRVDDLDTDPLIGQRPAAIAIGVVMAAGLIAVLVTSTVTGAPESAAAVSKTIPNLQQLGHLLFTDYLLPFEVTSALLIIAVVGAVMLSRTVPGEEVDADEPVVDFSTSTDDVGEVDA